MARRAQNADGRKLWKEFSRRHRSFPCIKQHTLYALPGPLIDKIASMESTILSPTEVEFERDLAETTTGGFFHQRPFSCPFLPDPYNPGKEQAIQTLDETYREEMKGGGASDVQAERQLQAEQRQREEAELRDLAYISWLMMNSEFLRERDRLLNSYKPQVATAGCFPVHRISIMGERPDSLSPVEEAFLPFYHRWGLHTFLTWEVPVPMPPQVGGLVYHDTISLAGAGMLLFLPWHLLRDNRLSLQQLAQQLRRARHPTHLDDWFSRDARRKRLGYTRLKTQLILRWCLRLALASRYGESRLNGHIQQLDEALGFYLNRGEDSIKKLRLSLE